MQCVSITIGSDPECFAVNAQQHVIPAYFAIGGDRDIELPFGMAYPDGAAIEFTVLHHTDPAVVAQRIGENIKTLQDVVAAPICVRSNGYVAQTYIDALPVTLGKRASLQMLGCDRDERVYPWAENIKRPDPKTYPWRTLGGHIHIGVGGYVVQNMPLVQFTVAMLDALLGTAGTYLCDEQESRDRKKLYGKSGTIRLKAKLGTIEYRPLPAKALISNYTLALHMFTLAQKVGYFAQQVLAENAGDLAALYRLVGEHEYMRLVTWAIDEHDVQTCRKVQLDSANRYDALSFSPGFMPHVAALQAMRLPADFSVEW